MALDGEKPEDYQNPVPTDKDPYFDVNQDKASDYLDYLAQYPRSKQICICGHTVASHKYSTSIGYTCKPNNHWCPCDVVQPVYFASNSRHFKRATHGPGMKHALSMGIVAMKKAGTDGQWLIPLKCMFPGCTNPEIVPAPLTKDNFIPARPTALNVLLCRGHVIEFGGDLIW